MGLDVHAASHLRYARPIPRGAAFDRLEGEVLKTGKCLDEAYFFPSRNDACFRSRMAGMRSGLYAYTRATRQHSFRAGSYTAYNWWRDQLSHFALGVAAAEVWSAPRRYRGRPFVELLNFSDCGGTFGTRVSAKLADDFAAHTARARKYKPIVVVVEEQEVPVGEDEMAYWRDVYRDFARAFALAARGGALRFC